MNVSTAQNQRPATAPAGVPPSAPARERLRASMAPADAPLVPDSLLNARVSNGTVASQVDRSVRVRFDGDGPRATAPIVPETSAARTLLNSPAGPGFEQLLRSIAASSNRDGARPDNLSTISFTPDVPAVAGVRVLNAALQAAQLDGRPLRISQDDAKALAKSIAANTPDYLSGTLAWNSSGHIVMTPDQSRTLLATVGAYRPVDGDDVALPWAGAQMFGGKLAPGFVREGEIAQRAAIIKDAFMTAAHERMHSDSPPMARRESEVTGVSEEAAAEVSAGQVLGRVIRSTGSSLHELAANIGRQPDRGGLGWKPWNRDAIAQPTGDATAEIVQRYVDAPKTLRSLLSLTGADRRTTEGQALATDLLQGRQAQYMPRRIADAIRGHHGIADEHRESIVDLVRTSLTDPDGLASLRNRLRALRAD